MSNIKQFFDKDGNDIFPVTHASAVFDDEGVSLNDYIDDIRDDKFIYGANNITKYFSKKGLKINVIGDSIGAGANATNNNGFLYQFIESYRIENDVDKVIVQGFLTFGLTGDNTGLGLLNRILPPSISFNLFGAQWNIPQYDYQIKITYSSRADGGSFNVKVNEEILKNYSCEGDNADGIETEWIDIPANSNVVIDNTSNKNSYLNFYQIRKQTYDEKNTIHYANFSVGGRKAADYTSENDILSTSFYNNPDILIWELGNNDYSNNTLTRYKEYLEIVAAKAKENDVELIIITCCRNSAADNDGIVKTNFEDYKAFNLSIAKLYDYCHIDYDSLFGCYNNAKANGLIADTIHPNDYGHGLMADVLSKIFNMTNYYTRNIQINYKDTRFNYEYTNINRPLWFENYAVFNYVKTKTADNNGNQNYLHVTPVFTHYNVNALPKYARKGMIAIIENGIYVNNVDCTDSFNVKAVWRPIITIASSSTNRPTTNNISGSLLYDTTLGKLLVWKNNRWQDILGNDDNTEYVKKSDYDSKIAELEELIRSITTSE